MDLLNHPAVQGGVAPLLVALVIAPALARTRFAWLAIIGGYATTIALTAGFQFSPLTASRKILLAGLIASVIGIAADLLPRGSRAIVAGLALAAGLASIWVFASVLVQRQGAAFYLDAAGIAVFVTLLTALVLAVRHDGSRAGAVGLGLATGVAAILSASINFLLAGVSLAAASGARCGGDATGKFKRTDFGMKTGVPSVGDEVTLLSGLNQKVRGRISH